MSCCRGLFTVVASLPGHLVVELDDGQRYTWHTQRVEVASEPTLGAGRGLSRVKPGWVDRGQPGSLPAGRGRALSNAAESNTLSTPCEEREVSATDSSNIAQVDRTPVSSCKEGASLSPAVAVQEWQCFTDPKTERPWWWNERLQQVRWDPPS